MTRESVILELETMYKQEGMRHVRDLQETIEREARMDALEYALDILSGKYDVKEIDAWEAAHTVNEKELIGKLGKANVEVLDTPSPIVKVKYLTDIIPIEKLPQGSWVDLRCAKTVSIKAGTYAQIPLGIAMELPEGYEAVVAPRSSTFKKYGVLLANSLGVIDPDYCGDNDQWHFLAYAVRDTVIEKNERICQFRIQRRQPEFEFMNVEHLGNPDRGGIGSTGRV